MEMMWSGAPPVFSRDKSDGVPDLGTPTVVDGSVSRVPPRTGWGAVLRAEGRTLQTYSGGTCLALSSLRAEMETVTRAFEMTDGLNPAPGRCSS